MERWTAKLLALIGAFVLPLLCTILPYKISGFVASKGAVGKRTLSYLMCLGGGIFFGTYLLHMGPEVQNILKTSLLDPHGITYPVAELIAGAGFFIVLFAEKFVLRWNKRRTSRKLSKLTTLTVDVVNVTVNHTEEQATLVSARRPDVVHCTNSDEPCAKCLAGEPCSGLYEEMFAGKDNQHAPDKIANNTAMVTNSYNTPSVVADDLSRHLDVMGDSSRQTKGDSCISDQLQFCNNGSQWEKVTVIPIKKDDKNVAIDIDKSHDHSEGGGHHHHATRSIILILALSLHRIFEGMSIGLQDTLTNVASLFVAVMCHEMVIGLSLGLQFVKSQFSFRRLMITSLVCSSIMPVGVLIGLVMTETRSNSSSIDVANGVLQAIAMGTFIYVTFFEILQEEVNPEDTSIAKVVFIAIGFAMMALLILIPEEQLVVHSLVHNVTSAAVESWQVTPPM